MTTCLLSSSVDCVTSLGGLACRMIITELVYFQIPLYLIVHPCDEDPSCLCSFLFCAILHFTQNVMTVFVFNWPFSELLEVVLRPLKENLCANDWKEHSCYSFAGEMPFLLLNQCQSTEYCTNTTRKVIYWTLFFLIWLLMYGNL